MHSCFSSNPSGTVATTHWMAQVRLLPKRWSINLASTCSQNLVAAFRGSCYSWYIAIQKSNASTDFVHNNKRALLYRQLLPNESDQPGTGVSLAIHPAWCISTYWKLTALLPSGRTNCHYHRATGCTQAWETKASRLLRFSVGVNMFNIGLLTFWVHLELPPLLLEILASALPYICLFISCHIHDTIPQLFSSFYLILAYFYLI